MIQNINGVQEKSSQTALDSVYSLALANKKYKGRSWGPDSLAEIFLSPELLNNVNNPSSLEKEIEQKQLRGIYAYNIARTMYFDQLFKKHLLENVPQIVILGAGYDTRAFRFQELIKETVIFELDIITTQKRKEKCLSAARIQIPNNLRMIPIDFTKHSLKKILAKADFNEKKKTLFIWEGVAPYLTPEAVDNTLDFVKSNSPTGSLISFDYLHVSRYNISGYGVMEFIKFMKSNRSGEPSRFSIKKGEIELFLEQRGFEMIDHFTPNELEERFLKLSDGSLIGRVLAVLFIVKAAVK